MLNMTEPLVSSLWPRDESVPLVDHTIGSLLAERAVTHADATALAGVAHGGGAERRLTYGQLYTEARRVAAALLRLAEPGSSSPCGRRTSSSGRSSSTAPRWPE